MIQQPAEISPTLRTAIKRLMELERSGVDVPAAGSFFTSMTTTLFPTQPGHPHRPSGSSVGSPGGARLA
jgi:hypothetical protein